MSSSSKSASAVAAAGANPAKGLDLNKSEANGYPSDSDKEEENDAEELLTETKKVEDEKKEKVNDAPASSSSSAAASTSAAAAAPASSSKDEKPKGKPGRKRKTPEEKTADKEKKKAEKAAEKAAAKKQKVPLSEEEKKKKAEKAAADLEEKRDTYSEKLSPNGPVARNMEKGFITLNICKNGELLEVKTTDGTTGGGVVLYECTALRHRFCLPLAEAMYDDTLPIFSTKTNLVKIFDMWSDEELKAPLSGGCLFFAKLEDGTREIFVDMVALMAYSHTTEFNSAKLKKLTDEEKEHVIWDNVPYEVQFGVHTEKSFDDAREFSKIEAGRRAAIEEAEQKKKEAAQAEFVKEITKKALAVLTAGGLCPGCQESVNEGSHSKCAKAYKVVDELSTSPAKKQKTESSTASAASSSKDS